MDLFLCWFLGPAILLAVVVGLSFGLELISGLRAPWCVRPALGVAVMLVIAQLGVSTDATAELTIPVIVALGAFGLLMGWSTHLTDGPLPGWAIAAALGVFFIFGAPVLLSGDPTWAGYIKLDDSATWMGLTDHAFNYGHRTTGFAPSTWEALVSINAGNGYPIGSFVPMALIGKVTGQDVAWTLQPSMAWMAAVLTLLLAEILRPAAPQRQRERRHRLHRHAVGDAARLHVLGRRSRRSPPRSCSLSRRSPPGSRSGSATSAGPGSSQGSSRRGS